LDVIFSGFTGLFPVGKSSCPVVGGNPATPPPRHSVHDGCVWTVDVRNNPIRWTRISAPGVKSVIRAVVKLLGKRWWIPAGARIEGPRAEARARRAESRGGVPDRRPNTYKLCRVVNASKEVPDLKYEVPDLLLEVVDLKQEVPDLRSSGIPLNLTPASADCPPTPHD